MTVQLSLIIVNYNVRYFLEHCLLSAQRAMENIAGEILVIDNHSTDGSLAYLKTRFPGVRFMAMDSNLGFGRANNLAVQQARGKWVLFLNPDTLLAENTLRDMLVFLESKPDCGAAGLHMVDGRGCFLPESKRSQPTPLVSLFKLTGLTAAFPHSAVFGKYALGYLPEKEVYPVPVLAGAFMAVSRQLFVHLGGFDPMFFMYGEDVDLSCRITEAGYRNYYLGNLSIIHFKGESLDRNSVHFTYIFYQAMVLFVQKHYTGFSGFLMRVFLNTGIVIRAGLAGIASLFKKKKKKKLDRHTLKHIGLLGLGEGQLPVSVRKLFAAAHFSDYAAGGDFDAVLICPGAGFTYRQAIDWLEAHPVHIPVLWYPANGHSIIYSPDKNNSGQAWPLEDSAEI